MKRENRYGIKSLTKDFPNDDVCLDFIFDALHSRECSCGGTYKKVKSRKQYQCSKCRFQIAPTAGTVFHKSDTELVLWFKAILAFSNAKSGISAAQLERELEVTYKTAWRMLTLIRKALIQSGDKLSGTVEIDGAYFGGVYTSSKKGKNHSERFFNKSVVIGAIERGGKVKAQVVENLGADTHWNFLRENVERGSKLMSDSTRVLESAEGDYKRFKVDHSKKEYVRGNVYVNSIESFWSHVKRSIKGTHKGVSKKHLQSYLDAFTFLWNNSHSDKERFAALLGMLLQPSK